MTMHEPCCSAHNVDMTCERYRRTHFVEVRPCCAADAAVLAQEWRVGNHYGIHVYCGDRPVATFHDKADAERAVQDHNEGLGR